MESPLLDPTPIFEHFRGNFATELLTAAVAHFNLVGMLADGPAAADALRDQLGLAERPFVVLTTALRAMGLLKLDGDQLGLTPIAQAFLTPGAEFDVGGYVGLAAEAPGVVEMVQRLRTNTPAGAGDDEGGAGAAFIFREGIASAMEREASARSLTMALAGRARIVAPVLADRVPLESATCLLDVAGGTGLYAIAWLLRHPRLRAIVWDRPEVLRVAREQGQIHGVGDRLEAVAGDMFRDPVPAGADAALLSNVLHDWDVPECRALVGRLAGELPAGGRLIIHDAFLDDDLGGPLPVALYSASLFRLTEGRAYSGAEYAGWLLEAGLEPGTPVQTAVHGSALVGRKPGAGMAWSTGAQIG